MFRHIVSGSAIEVGNIFRLGTRFADAFGLTYQDERGAPQKSSWVHTALALAACSRPLLKIRAMSAASSGQNPSRHLPFT